VNRPTRHADVAVVGLGAVGSAIACALARRGARVAGIDRWHPPHDHGSSHGRTRITRLAVGEGAAYVPLVQRSHELWRQLESDTGLALMRRTGVLVIASPGADAGAFHGQTGFFERTVGLARQFGIAHELLSDMQVRERFPAFATQEGDRAYHEPDGGVLFPEDCIRAQWRVAQRLGASLRPDVTLLEMSSSPGGVTLTTDRGTLHAAQAVLCTGAWLPGQIGGAVQARLRVLRQVLHWFETDRPERFDPDRCPAYIWLHGPTFEDSFYGFPMVDDIAGVKVATEQVREETEPDLLRREVGREEASAMHERHVRGRVPDLRPTTLHDAACMYTMAPDGHFLVGRHPRHEHATIVSACSGHGFKHAPGLGEAIAEQLLGKKKNPLLAPFEMA
jgi:sarcosine oxidase